MSRWIVDVNVPIVANDEARISQGKQPRANHVDDVCRLAAIRSLRDLVRSGIIVVDELGAVMKEYRKKLDGSGQPGVGDEFLKHVSDHLCVQTRVQITNLTFTSKGEYAAFPSDPELEKFDKDDRIFVALAIENIDGPRILNAVDSDYSEHQKALEKHGIFVQELCPSRLKKKRGAKST